VSGGQISLQIFVKDVAAGEEENWLRSGEDASPDSY